MNNKIIDVNGFKIGGDKTFLIADVGSNHMQDLDLAKESIKAAWKSGADAVKFQSISLDELYYLPDPKTSAFIKKLEFPEKWHKILSDYAKQIGIIFFSSPTYLNAVDLLEDINVPIYKLASAQIGTFPQIVEKVAKLGKPTIFSTGISNFKEVIYAVEIFEKFKNNNYMILHCNSIYPVPAHLVNLPLMDTYNSMFKCPIGFSDHSEGIHIPLAAVANGAKIIEKHFTLDKKFKSPDSNSFAADPNEFKTLVEQVREVEKSMLALKPRLEIQKEEKNFKNSILYRAQIKKDIVKGDILHHDDFNFIRSKKGLDARTIYNKKVLGKANKNLFKGNIIEEKDLDFK